MRQQLAVVQRVSQCRASAIGSSAATTFARAPHPGFLTLRNRWIAKEPDLDLVEPVGNEDFSGLPSVRNRFGFVVEATVDIDADKIVRRIRSTVVVSAVATDSAHCRSLSMMYLSAWLALRVDAHPQNASQIRTKGSRGRLLCQWRVVGLPFNYRIGA